MNIVEDQRPLGRLDRPSWHLRLAVGGIAFLLALALVFRLRMLFLGLENPLSINENWLNWAGRLLLVGLLITPLLHLAIHWLAARLTDRHARQGYGQMLLAPLVLNVLALPALAVNAVSPDATLLSAVNLALVTIDLLVYFQLRRFPATARIVETNTEIVVYRA